MTKFKNPLLLTLIIIGSVAIAVTFIHLARFKVPEGEVPPPRKIDIIKNQITPPATPLPNNELPSGSQNNNAGKTENKIVKITVRGDEFNFLPSSFKVARGSKVELTFENTGTVPHNYVVDKLKLKTKIIDGGKTDVVTFTAPSTAGTVTYVSYCSVPGHREAGMEGTIVIE